MVLDVLSMQRDTRKISSSKAVDFALCQAIWALRQWFLLFFICYSLLNSEAAVADDKFLWYCVKWNVKYCLCLKTVRIYIGTVQFNLLLHIIWSHSRPITEINEGGYYVEEQAYVCVYEKELPIRR